MTTRLSGSISLPVLWTLLPPHRDSNAKDWMHWNLFYADHTEKPASVPPLAQAGFTLLTSTSERCGRQLPWGICLQSVLLLCTCIKDQGEGPGISHFPVSGFHLLLVWEWDPWCFVSELMCSESRINNSLKLGWGTFLKASAFTQFPKQGGLILRAWTRAGEKKASVVFSGICQGLRYT